VTVPGEGYVDKGNLRYFGGHPFVENGEWKTPCPHATFVGKSPKGHDVWRIPLSFVIFIGHPEEYKTEGYCVLCAVDFVRRTESGT